MTELGLFSGAVLVARDGAVIEHACGMADVDAGVANTVDTRFKLMSVSKTITGVAVLQLSERERLRLEDPVAEHVVDWPKEWDAVTVHDLLDHTSGIPNLDVRWSAASRRLRDEGGDRGLANVWRQLAPTVAQPLVAKPGTTHRYGNFNTILAGLVAETAAMRPYPELVRRRVLDPAGMTATGFDDGARHAGLAIGYFLGHDGRPTASEQNMAHIQPAGGFWSTVGDLYRFDRALRGDVLLGEEARKRLVTPRGKHTYGYACCFRNSPIHGRPCVHHSGGNNGFVADFLRFVDDDACVVVLSNYAFAPIGRVSRDLAAMLFGLDVDIPVRVPTEALEACTGTYDQGRGVYRIVRRSGNVLVALSVWPGVERVSGQMLMPLGGNRFKVAAGDAVVTFDDGGDRRALVMGDTRITRRDQEPSGPSWTGTWETASGEGARITPESGALRLRSDALWPSSAEIVPVSDDVALALIDPTGGAVLRRQGHSLRYQTYAGEVVELTRSREE
jgi:CubicO group peptidase (beta-lactamase class C family)